MTKNRRKTRWFSAIGYSLPVPFTYYFREFPAISQLSGLRESGKYNRWDITDWRRAIVKFGRILVRG